MTNTQALEGILVWTNVEDTLLRYLIAADAAAELGDEELSKGLRIMHKEEKIPSNMSYNICGWRYPGSEVFSLHCQVPMSVWNKLPECVHGSWCEWKDAHSFCEAVINCARSYAEVDRASSGD